MTIPIQETFTNWLKENGEGFSGVFSVTTPDGILYQQAHGHRNKAEQLPNTTDTAFAIASGTKLFTGLAINKLINEKKLSLEDKLHDLLPHNLKQIDKRVNVFHLLTHTSGVGDYIDEEAEEDEDNPLPNLFDQYPTHLWTRLEYYLQMITPLPPKFEPGERYGYSNAGYILLGLVIEAISGVSYQQFVTDAIITPYGLTRTGFYRTDALPTNTAIGYMQDEDIDEWHTNIFSVPILGGSDGGLYTCAADIDKLWRSIDLTSDMFKSHVQIEDDGSESYGLGVYHYHADGKQAHFAVGGDAGVGFFTAYYPKSKVVISGFSNTGWIDGTYALISEIGGI